LQGRSGFAGWRSIFVSLCEPKPDTAIATRASAT
jgi:hypothetical protein